MPGSLPRSRTYSSFSQASVLSIVVGLGLSRIGAAEEVPPLAPVVVTASRLAEPLSEVPASVSVIDRSDVQDGRPTLGIDEALDRVPGLFAQSSSNYAQDVRLQIRGFGSRAEFGVREIKVLVDGLPETLPDGQTDIDAVDMGAIDRIEVLRGPASSLYGNASGGVIQLFTEEAGDAPRGEFAVSGGSFGMTKFQAKGSAKAAGASAFVHASHFEIGGYRDHSAARSTTATVKLRYEIDARSDVTLLLNAIDAPRGDDAGGLRRAEADTNPRGANPRNIQFDSGEAVQQGRIGAVVSHRFEQSEISGYSYVLYRDFDNRLPIGPTSPAVQGGIVTFQRFSPGGGLRYRLDGLLLGLRHTFSAGFDVQHQADDRRRYVNLDGARGSLGLMQHEEVTNVGPYIREAVHLTDKLEASLGLRYDTTRLAVDVDVPSNSDGSGSRTLDSWSPSAGLAYQARSDVVTFVNVGTAFQVPTTTELANPRGAGFNPDVGPQHAISGELGTRFDSARWYAELSGFFIHVDDVLVRYETAEQPGRAFYRNAAHTRRFGLELAWQARLLDGLRWSSSITALETQFSEGRAEPGVPPWQVYEELRYDHPSGAFAAIELSAVDAYTVDNGSQNFTRAYELCHLRGGYHWASGRFTAEPYFGIQNLTNTNYDARVRINDANLRFFEPGPGIAPYGGILLSMNL